MGHISDLIKVHSDIFPLKCSECSGNQPVGPRSSRTSSIMALIEFPFYTDNFDKIDYIDKIGCFESPLANIEVLQRAAPLLVLEARLYSVFQCLVRLHVGGDQIVLEVCGYTYNPTVIYIHQVRNVEKPMSIYWF